MAQMPDSIDVRVTINKQTDLHFAAHIRAHCMSGDFGKDHSLADDLLCEIIKELGGEETIAAYLEVVRYCA